MTPFLVLPVYEISIISEVTQQKDAGGPVGRVEEQKFGLVF